MKKFGRRALAVVLVVLLLGLCACSAKTEPAQEETAASSAAEPAQEAAKPEEAPVAEKPSKEEEPDAAIEERAAGARSARGDGRIAYVHDQHQLRDDS